MRFKLDENPDLRLVSLVAGDGHDVDTVQDEGLSGGSNERIYKGCRSAAGKADLL